MGIICYYIMSAHVAILGHGVVGGGVSRILLDDSKTLSQKVGCSLELAAICTKDPEKEDPKFFAEHSDLFRTAEEILSDPNIQIICETIGGDTIAYEFVKTALQNGKHVVTANKKMVAKHFEELSALSQKHNAALLFEASVGGGIPCLAALRNGISGDSVQEIEGILNGTTNFILTKMEREGLEFSEVLTEAQEKGYAEADPTDDVEGFDAAYKLTILIALAFGVYLAPQDIETKGISSLRAVDFAYAKSLGKKIKLLGSAAKTENGISAQVSPALVSNSSRIAKTDGVLNAINFVGKYNTEGNFLSGEGAGRFPTAAAIVSDIVSIARGEEAIVFSRPTAKKVTNTKQAWYLRFLVNDEPGIVGKIGTIFGNYGISIDSVHQADHQLGSAHFVVTTMPVEREIFEQAKTEVSALSCNAEEPFVMPISGE